MESITKNRQSAETLRTMIARAYGADAVPEGDDFAEEMVRLFGQGLEVRHDGSDRGGAR